jgi:hypothetical protein
MSSDYDAAFFEKADFATGVPMTLQERACASLIWYTPRLAGASGSCRVVYK